MHAGSGQRREDRHQMPSMASARDLIVKKRPLVALPFTLAILFLGYYSSVAPANARELRQEGASTNTISARDSTKDAESSDLVLSSVKDTRSPASSPASFRFGCDPRSLGITEYDGGSIAYCKKKDLKAADTDSAIIEIKPGAARAPHWHDTWEQQIVISGKAKTYLIDDKGQIHEEVLTEGMIAVLPAGMTHWTESVGDQTAVISLSFPAGFKTFELNDSLIQVGRNDRSCTQERKASCKTERKSLILIVKDGLL